MTTQAQWERLPVELRERPQWLLAGPNEKGELKVPLTITADGRLAAGSSTDAGTWLDFDYAAACALEYGYGLGYVLAAADPFSCVDFDVKDAQNAPDKPDTWTTPERMEQYRQLVQYLASYTELSQSGKGVHVWCRGKIGEGVKRMGVEVYSQARFIACTGNVVHALPIADRQDELSALAASMRESAEAARAGASVLDAGEQTESDDVVMTRAWNAENSGKFRALWSGDWGALGYPSQSEADLSLMSMLTFYSRSDEQCRRLFRMSGLGQREKAQQNDRYLDYTLRLIRGRQAREDKVEQATAEQGRRLAAQLLSEAEVAKARAYAAELQGLAAGGAQQGPQQAAGAPPSLPPVPPGPPPTQAPQPGAGGVPLPQGLDWPPGLAGAIAWFIYNSAPRPVKEVAIVAALGWLAGVCGKAWNIPGSGLNLYIILVARSAIGKEAMHSGLGALVNRIREGVPTAGNFVDFSDFASGPALAKACAQNSSFVNVAGEWGRKLQRLAYGEKDGPMQQLRTIMTNLYQKSGPASIVGGITYSNKDSNVASISGVAFSMIGETTPGTLYDSLTDSMMEDGFLSRFTIVEYDGLRPPLNPNPQQLPDKELAEACQALCLQATTLLNNHRRTPITRDADAAVIMDAFDKECDVQINSTTDESWRQMWNRAHLKMARIAGLLAVGDNHMEPCIRAHHVQWALDVIRRDIAIMQRRLESGDIGIDDTARERKLLSILREYLTSPPPTSYGVPEAMQRDAMVPRKYLQIRVSGVSSFKRHNYGATRALDEAIRSLCDSGYITEVDKNKAAEQYGFQGKCYRIVSLPKFS